MVWPAFRVHTSLGVDDLAATWRRFRNREVYMWRLHSNSRAITHTNARPDELTILLWRRSPPHGLRPQRDPGSAAPAPVPLPSPSRDESPIPTVTSTSLARSATLLWHARAPE